MAAMLGFVSCIEPPLHLPGQDLAVDVQVAQTELNLVWDNEVQIEHEWYYGWDLKDDSIWGGLAYPHPSSYEVYRYYKGDDPLAKHSGVDVFTIDNNRFRRYFQFGYYDMLFYSNIDSQDGTQVLVIKESADSVIATTTGTRGLSRSILNASRADEGDAPLGVLNQPDIPKTCISHPISRITSTTPSRMSTSSISRPSSVRWYISIWCSSSCLITTMDVSKVSMATPLSRRWLPAPTSIPDIPATSLRWFTSTPV